MPEDCLVCDHSVDPDAGKFADTKPVWVDGEDLQDELGGKAYHLGCESEVFEEVYNRV